MPDSLFSDISDVPSGRAFDIRSGSMRAVPPTDLLFVGFSCEDVSQLNTRRSSAKSCVRSASLRTGQTLAHSLKYIESIRPYLIRLENVAALDDVDPSTGDSNASDVVSLLESLGYFVTYQVVDARQHGSAQRRTRWWGVAVRLSENSLTAEDIDYMEPARESLLSVLEDVEMDQMSLDSVLLPEGSDELAEWQRWRRGADEEVEWKDGQSSDEEQRPEVTETETKKSEANWPDLHAEIFRVRGLRFPLCLEMCYSAQELHKLAAEFPLRPQ